MSVDNPITMAERIEVATYKCLSSLMFMVRYMFKSFHKRKFVVNHHHEKIAAALERVLTGECLRLMIHIAPRYGKTELAVKQFVAHGLALNPAAKFIHLSYSDMLALDNSEEIRDLIQEEAYQQLFPYVKLAPDSTAKKKWYTTAGGGVYATSAAGQVTGFGAGQVDQEDDELIAEVDALGAYIADSADHHILKKRKFGGAIIIDDPIKPEDADSEVKRERINQRFDSTIRNRTNSRKTPIIIIMQRLHPRDLAGYLAQQEPEDWEIISLPCIQEDGTALWPFKDTIEELKKKAKTLGIVFDRQYQQNPKPKEGLLFPEEELHYYNPETVDVEKLAEYKAGVIDPADEGSDDLSFPTGYLVGDKIYITNVIYNQHGTDINEPASVDWIVQNKLNAVDIESNSAWRLFKKAVSRKVQEVYSDCEIRGIHNSTNKHTRILEASAFIKNHFIFRADWRDIPEYRRFMENLTSYNRIQEGTSKNKHEDAPDSAALLAKLYRKRFAHLW